MSFQICCNYLTMITNFVAVHRADWPATLGTGGQGAGLGLKLCVMICEQGLDIHLLAHHIACNCGGQLHSFCKSVNHSTYRFEAAQTEGRPALARPPDYEGQLQHGVPRPQVPPRHQHALLHRHRHREVHTVNCQFPEFSPPQQQSVDIY